MLDSGGNIPNGGQIWFAAGQSYKAVLAPANDTDPPNSPYWTEDNLPGINDTTASQTEWLTGPQPTFVSGTQFTLVGDQTQIFKKARRLRFTVTAGTVYGTIASASFGILTTVNVTFTPGSALDSGLTAVAYSLIDPENPSINADYTNKQGSSAASAGSGTTDIWGLAGNSVHVTGTNAIFGFSTAPYAGAKRTVIFDGALSLNSSAANSMPGNLNVTTAANDRAFVYANTATSTIVSFYKASGKPVVAGTASTGITVSGENISVNVTSVAPLIVSSAAATQADQEAASSNIVVVTPLRQQFHPSAFKSWVYVDTGGNPQASYGISSVSDTGTGLATPNFATPFSTPNYMALVNIRSDATLICHQQNSGTFNASSCTFRSITTGGAGSDPNFWFMGFAGDQ